MPTKTRTTPWSPEAVRIEFEQKAQLAMKPPKLPPPEVKIVRPSYQPSKAELEEDMRVDATFDEAVKALTRPVRIRYIPRPKRSSR